MLHTGSCQGCSASSCSATGSVHSFVTSPSPKEQICRWRLPWGVFYVTNSQIFSDAVKAWCFRFLPAAASASAMTNDPQKAAGNTSGELTEHHRTFRRPISWIGRHQRCTERPAGPCRPASALGPWTGLQGHELARDRTNQRIFKGNKLCKRL